MPEIRNDDLLGLARAIHARLPVEQLTPHEHEDFDKNAKLWFGRVADDNERVRGSGYGLGLQDIVPEATALALITAQTAMGSVIQDGLNRLWRSLTRRRRGRREPLPALSDMQKKKLRTQIVRRLVELGVSEPTAILFADSVVAELAEKDGGPGQ